MADYRLSAQIIKRSTGKSAVAAAAYRAGLKLEDERTGLVHDYSRKGGVLHSEVMTPVNTPDWMHDRAKLWNAVEAVEKRKNSQLAREIQLSLPHELTPEQRTKLVQDFAQEQFVARGMIADIAIHAPNPKGDERNYHAHIMLTMRELTSEGFHSKKSTPTARGWNDDELLQTWREKWAQHQNRSLERHGYSERVDHRSFAARGIDREPQQHLGVAANDMLAKGKQSRIEEENNVIRIRNADRAMKQARAAQQAITMSERRVSTFERAASQPDRDSQELAKRHEEQQKKLKAEQRERYQLATLQAEVKAINRKLEASGFRKKLRDVFGVSSRDQSERDKLTKTISDAQSEMKLEQQKLKDRQQQEIKQRETQERERMGTKVFRDFDQSRNAPAAKRSQQKEQDRKETDRIMPEPPPPRELQRRQGKIAEKSPQRTEVAHRQGKTVWQKKTSEKPSREISRADAREKWRAMTDKPKPDGPKPPKPTRKRSGPSQSR